MKWLEAFYQHVDRPSWTNREASGLIRFARAAYNAHVKDPKVPLTVWDWYAYALPALGWTKERDRFKVDTAHQLQPYPKATELRAALVTLTSELDEAGVPFRLIVDPRGTDEVFRKLAADAWEVVKQLRAQGLPESARPPELLAREWEAQQPKAAAKSEPQLEAQPVSEPLKADASSGGAGGLVLLLLLASGKKQRRGGRKRKR